MKTGTRTRRKESKRKKERRLGEREGGRCPIPSLSLSFSRHSTSSSSSPPPLRARSSRLPVLCRARPPSSIFHEREKFGSADPLLRIPGRGEGRKRVSSLIGLLRPGGERERADDDDERPVIRRILGELARRG